MKQMNCFRFAKGAHALPFYIPKRVERNERNGGRQL
jgi:hypothetical protein